MSCPVRDVAQHVIPAFRRSGWRHRPVSSPFASDSMSSRGSTLVIPLWAWLFAWSGLQARSWIQSVSQSCMYEPLVCSRRS